MDRTFTLDEAEELLPVLESLLKKAMRSKEELREAEQQIEKLSTKIFLNGGMLVDIRASQAMKDARDRALQRIKDAVREIDAIGVQVKDLDIGLLDFPCELDGEIILLCWKLGEHRIGFWHSMEEGFKGRKPIDGRIRGQNRNRS